MHQSDFCIKIVLISVTKWCAVGYGTETCDLCNRSVVFIGWCCLTHLCLVMHIQVTGLAKKLQKTWSLIQNNNVLHIQQYFVEVKWIYPQKEISYTSKTASLLTHWPWERYGSKFYKCIFHTYVMNSCLENFFWKWSLLLKVVSGDCHRTPLMSQHYIR